LTEHPYGPVAVVAGDSPLEEGVERLDDVLPRPVDVGGRKHELGHCLIDSAHSNPRAAHLLDHPEEWSDGVHCPYNCVLNDAKNLGLTELLSQWWEFDFDHRCWKAVRGRWQD